MRIQQSLMFLCALAAGGAAQSPDGAAARAAALDPRVMLEYASFDPNVAVPQVPAALRAGADVNLHILQFFATPTDADRAAVRQAGGVIRGYLPHDCHLVEADGSGQSLRALEGVRWVGPYEPAYRLEPALLKELARGQAPQRRYNLVMADKALRMRVEFGCANANGHGARCGPLTDSFSGSSALGATFQFEVADATPNFFAILGLGTATSAPYPFDLSLLGWTNCTSFAPSTASFNVATGPTGAAAYALSVPNNPMLTGARVYGQWLNLDTSEPGNLTFSGLTRMICGSDL
ncbi:MAG: hypothetical protein VYA51_03100 [Planctomycetota bacterium]|nr:hypothetical protein [Planctomycetota bacterium]